MRWLTFEGFAAAFAGLCWDASIRLPEEYPSLSMCFNNPEKYEGKPVWILPDEVVVSKPGYFEVLYWGDRVRIYSSKQPPLGSHVMVYGTSRIDRTVEAISWVEERGFRAKCRGVLIVSLLVLAAGAFVFRRTFAWRDGAFHPRQEN